VKELCVTCGRPLSGAVLACNPNGGHDCLKCYTARIEGKRKPKVQGKLFDGRDIREVLS
jgi:hypothetical protein